MDRNSIQYTYTSDNRNLLKEKSTAEGLTITYNYQNGTNLCTKTLCKYNGTIQERKFCTYDANGQLASLIEDDGSREDESDLKDVTFRRHKTIEMNTEPGAAYGKPKKIIEYQGHEVPLKTTLINYDHKGCEIKREILDSDERSCYKLTKKYDQRLRLIEENDPLGHITQYKYDDSNNKIEEELVGSGKKTTYEYDLGNRLTKKTENHDNGKIFTTNYQYDHLNQLISEKDPYGHVTHYKYDRFGNQVECVKPPVPDTNGNLIYPTISHEYNILNQKISEKNENAHETKYEYNVYGSPTQIIYPDGAIEYFTYTPCGWLKQKWNADQTSISYTYDPKGQLIEKTYLDKQGQSLKKEAYHYKGTLLKSKIDEMGLVTTYRYDGVGRKIEENISNLKVITYSYDDFDRLIKKDENGRQEIYEYDWLDQVISKTSQDSYGNIFGKETYQYDIQGNQIEKTIWQAADQQSIFHSSYDSTGLLCSKENPYNHLTQWEYNDAYINELGQQVQQRVITDPLKRTIIETDDTHKRLAKQEYFQGQKRLSCIQFFYDPMGHLTRQQTFVMDDGQPFREYTIIKSYNSRGLLEIETQEDKTTHHLYDDMGRLIQKKKPDGVSLYYTYDALDRMQTLNSSDRTISYSYTYDLHDNIIVVNDHVHNRILHRSFDNWSRLEREEFAPEIVLQYAYDAQDRITSMILPNGSTVTYTYDPFHLRKIQRHAQQTYECECLYNWQNLIQIRSPSGSIDYTYDLLGRTIAIQTPHWASYLEEFDPAGNLLKMKQKDPSGTFDSHFAYDRFDHISQELSIVNNQFDYDSLGNCLRKNNHPRMHNHLNQLTKDEDSQYRYDANGNLKTQSSPKTIYAYDALNRLISCEKEGKQTTFLYDAFGRCLEITDPSETKQLLYQKEQEIGSLVNGQLHEFRLIHPESAYDLTLAIELNGKEYFPIQDSRNNICALQKPDGSLIEWTRYTAFGTKQMESKSDQFNPWQFANRREVIDLALFAHRFYNPKLMRWQTTDPLRFKEGLNLYRYVRNNPFCYKDPDGQFAIAAPIIVPIIEGTFGKVVIISLLPHIGPVLLGAAAGVAIYYAYHQYNVYHQNQIDASAEPAVELEDENAKAKDKGKPPVRTKPKNLAEQLTLEEARANPGKETKKLTINDPRYPTENWAKMQHTHTNNDATKINIHYWENRQTGEKHGFKFKND